MHNYFLKKEDLNFASLQSRCLQMWKRRSNNRSILSKGSLCCKGKLHCSTIILFSWEGLVGDSGVCHCSINLLASSTDEEQATEIWSAHFFPRPTQAYVTSLEEIYQILHSSLQTLKALYNCFHICRSTRCKKALMFTAKFSFKSTEAQLLQSMASQVKHKALYIKMREH